MDARDYEEWCRRAPAVGSFADRVVVVALALEPATYNVWTVDSDFGHVPCVVDQPAGAWLSDDFGSPCITVESGSR